MVFLNEVVVAMSGVERAGRGVGDFRRGMCALWGLCA